MRLSGTTRHRNDAALVPGWHTRWTSSLPRFPKIVSPPTPSRPRGSRERTEDPTSDPREGCSGFPCGSCRGGAARITARHHRGRLPMLGLNCCYPSVLEVLHWEGEGVLSHLRVWGSFRPRLGEVTSNSPHETTCPPRSHPGSSEFLETSSLATVARPWTHHFRGREGRRVSARHRARALWPRLWRRKAEGKGPTCKLGSQVLSHCGQLRELGVVTVAINFPKRPAVCSLQNTLFVIHPC